MPITENFSKSLQPFPKKKIKSTKMYIKVNSRKNYCSKFLVDPTPPMFYRRHAVTVLVAFFLNNYFGKCTDSNSKLNLYW